ncbi:hypothetical protein [Methylobacter sp. S3L5C]|uniref:hypothetical protein n=1 Tax=Methylobacter sp. S3L5C TaxID=2839024 RepID=UPI001FAD3813|nr:hypothetical protein [Methylobacter sp. S3L5C]UOA07775.1 hypothetical protein KKZ03_16180 [Methylobacter sp. S3L5C]
MPLSQKKRLILIKLEAAYGTDSGPAITDAVLCSGLDIAPLEGSSVERDFIRPYFANSGSIRVESYASVSFDTEVAGSMGAAGVAPEWGLLLKAASFSETITAAAITGACGAAGSLTTIALAAAASAIDDFYTGMTVTIVAGTGITQTGEIIGYVGSTKVATISRPWALAPALTTSTYSIGANVIYTPNSNFSTGTANTSATIYFNLDGVRHVLLGARGTMSFDLSPKAIPKMKWKFTGLLGTITDSPQVAPATDFTGWQTPVTVSTANTTDIHLLGYNGAAIEKLSFDIANTVTYRQTLGSESVLITDRKPSGSISLEAGLIATKDWWTAVKDSTTGAFAIKHGQTAGNIVGFTCPKVQLSAPKYSDSNGVAMLDLSMALLPYGVSGNDEIRICSK